MKSLMSFIGIVLYISILSAYAQNGTIKGTVTDAASDEPIPFLNVYLESDNTLGATTDFSGEYSLSVPAGTHEVVYSSLEYGKIKRTVSVEAGETTVENVNIGKKDVEVQTITVKTDKFEKPIEDIITSLEVIKPNVLENKGSTDVTSALEQAPGLTIVDGEAQLRGGSGYSFGAGSRVMILVDDMPLLSGDAGRPSWSYIPIENIEQIEVTKGASSVLYGSAALNGAINIRTAYPENEPKTRINFISGMYDSPQKKEAKWWEGNTPFYTGLSFLHSRKVNKAFSFVVSGNLYRENGFIGPTPTELYEDSLAFTTQKDMYFTESGDTVGFMPRGTEVVNTDSIDKNEVNPSNYEKRFRVNFNTTYKNQKIKGLSYGMNGSLQYSKSTSTLLWLNNEEGLYRAFPGAFTTTVQTQFNFDPYIHYYDSKGNKHTLNTRVYYLDNNNDNNQANKNTVLYGEYRYMKRFKNIPDFRISTGLVSTYVYSESELFRGITDDPSTNRTSLNVGAYVQLEKKLFGRLNLLGGARWEYFKIGDTEDNQPVF
ncbi:MAG: TonB-dependent receptor plug domain-containing protein, partial [Chitinophagales bacterium]